MVHYYGWYSNRSRGQRAKEKTASEESEPPAGPAKANSYHLLSPRIGICLARQRGVWSIYAEETS